MSIPTGEHDGVVPCGRSDHPVPGGNEVTDQMVQPVAVDYEGVGHGRTMLTLRSMDIGPFLLIGGSGGPWLPMIGRWPATPQGRKSSAGPDQRQFV
jgi:hypothetical protein